jgi:hypothetical protein
MQRKMRTIGLGVTILQEARFTDLRMSIPFGIATLGAAAVEAAPVEEEAAEAVEAAAVGAGTSIPVVEDSIEEPVEM